VKEHNIDYLLQYISCDELKLIKKRYNDYTIKDLVDERVLVLNNIRYLIKYGVKNINEIIVRDIEDLLVSDKDFREKIKKYEKKMSKEEIINMLENM
jgi:hypothetical protein